MNYKEDYAQYLATTTDKKPMSFYQWMNHKSIQRANLTAKVVEA